MKCNLGSLKETMKRQIVEELKARVLMTNKIQTLVNETVDRVFEGFEAELRERKQALENMGTFPSIEIKEILGEA